MSNLHLGWKRKKAEFLQRVHQLQNSLQKTTLILTQNKKSSLSSYHQLLALQEEEERELLSLRQELYRLEEKIRREEKEQEEFSKLKLFGGISLVLLLLVYLGMLLQPLAPPETPGESWNIGTIFSQLSSFLSSDDLLTGAHVAAIEQENLTLFSEENLTPTDESADLYTTTELIPEELITEDAEEEALPSPHINPQGFTQGFAEIGKLVIWSKRVKLDSLPEPVIKLPAEAQEIAVYEVNDGENKGEEKVKINDEKIKIKEVKLATLTTTQDNPPEKELTVEEQVAEVEVEYYTEAPTLIEIEATGRTKKITINSTTHYERILAHTILPYEAFPSQIKLYQTTNGERIEVGEVDYQDKNNNGFTDQISWLVPSLSTQTYEIIIEITDAEHLDAEKEFISDIYPQVYQQDDLWSEPIYHNEYIRVKFQENLTERNDITIYARNPLRTETIIEVYYFNSTEKITEFPMITNEDYYKVYLTGMEGSSDAFDLKIINKDNNKNTYLEFDHIIDPLARPGGIKGLQATYCAANNLSSSSNSFDKACQGSYPNACSATGDRVSCDDNIFEESVGNVTGNYMGVRINSTNTSLTDCASVNTVYLCYEWWAQDTLVSSDISVDVGDGGSWSSLGVTVGISANPGVTCTDVTSLESWNCSHFFGSGPKGALVRAYGQHTGGSTRYMRVDVLHFNVSYTSTNPIIYLKTQNCAAQSNAATNNVYDSNCDGSYPSSGNDYLSYDDNNKEVDSADSGKYAGVRANYNNTTVTDCGSITDVKLCYEWWADYTAEECGILVDADDGNSYTTVSSTCPGTSSNPGVTCTDVTSLESWSCNDFFGSEARDALARNYIREDSGFPSNYVQTDVLYFNVTYNSAPNTTEVILNSTSSENYTVGDLTCFANITDADAGDTLYADFTWYLNETVNSTGQQTTITNDGKFSLISIMGSENTTKDDNWTCEVRAYDGTDYEGDWNNASLVIINSPPEHTTPLLNATNINNNTYQNLTVYNQSTTDNDSDPIKNIYNWYLNDSSIMLVNMPFEANLTAEGNTKTKDYSPYALNGTPDKATYNATGGYDGKGAFELLEGADIVIPGSSLNLSKGGFTFGLWFKPSQFGKSRITDMIMHRGLGTGSRQIDLAHEVTGTQTSFHIGNSSSGAACTALDTTDPVVRTWYHYVGVYNTTHCLLYVNGSLKATGTMSGTMVRSTLDVRIGDYNNDTTYGINGTIDDFVLWNRSLSAKQIAALYNDGSGRNDLIVSQETFVDDVWNASITPNDGTEDGTTLMSNEVTIINSAPNTTEVILNSTSLENYTVGNLTCFANITDADAGDTLYADFTWYLNETVNSTGQQTTITNRKYNLISIMGSENTTKDDNWTCEVRAYDGTDYEGDWNNASLVIINSPPEHTTPLLNATNINNNTNQNLTVYNQSTADNDSDLIKNIYNWYLNDSSIMLVNMPFEANLTAEGNTKTKDYSPYALNGTPDKATYNATGGYDGKGAFELLEGADIVIPGSSLNLSKGGFTIGLWFKPSQFGKSRITDIIMHRGLGTGVRQFYLDHEITGSQTGFYIGNSSSATACTALDTTDPVINTWYHYVGVYNTTHCLLYVNGSLKATGTMGGTIIQSTTNIRIGDYNNDSTYGINGTIDDFIIWNRSLSAEQIASLYNNGVGRDDLIVSQETQTNDNWSAAITPNDGTADGETLRSNWINVTSGNTLPTAPLCGAYPLNTTDTEISYITNRTPHFWWNNSVDAEGDTLLYEIVVDDNPLFNNPEINATRIGQRNDINSSYNASTVLDVDTQYYWKVRANDSEDWGDYSQRCNFTIVSLVYIYLTTDTVAFGNMILGERNDTSDGNPLPFAAENRGNLVSNISVNATPYFTSSSIAFPSHYYQFKIRANEAGSFDTDRSNMTYINMSNVEATPNVVNIEWQEINNDCLIDLNVTVPDDELPEEKTSTVRFTIEVQ